MNQSLHLILVVQCCRFTFFNMFNERLDRFVVLELMFQQQRVKKQ